MDVIILISIFFLPYCDDLQLYHVDLDYRSYPSKIITVFDNLQDEWIAVPVLCFNPKNTFVQMAITHISSKNRSRSLIMI